MPNERRPRQYKERGPEIKLTTEQRELLQAAAAKRRLTLTEYIRYAALDQAAADVAATSK